MNTIILKIILFVSIHSIAARKPTVKKWIPNSNFESPENWNPKGVPCESQRIVYSEMHNEEVHLTKKNIIAREILLPRTGGIRLETNGMLEFSSDAIQYENCPGGDITFKKNIRESWMSSNNWKDINSKEDNQAIPHYERVPCQDDDVIFENGKSYEITMPRDLQNVNSIGDGVVKTLANEDWREEIEENSMIYHEWEDSVSPSVRIFPRNSECSLKEACPCQAGSLSTELCDNERPKCPPIRCLEPVIPQNHCCKICGGVLNLVEKKGFNVKDLRNRIQNKIDEWEVDGIDWHISTVAEINNKYQIQIVIVEKSIYDGRSVDLAKKLRQEFVNDVHFTSQMGLSGMPWDPTGSGGWEVLIMFFVVAIFFTGVMLYYYSPSAIVSTRPFGPLGFARFENRSREGSLIAVSHLSLNKAFDNPMYDTPASKSDEKSEFVEEPLNGSDIEEEIISEKED